MYRLTYQKPVTIFITVIGILNIAGIIAYFLGVHIYDQPPIVPIAFSFFVLLLVPLFVYRSAKKQFGVHLRLQEVINYTFEGDHIGIRGESFSTDMDLSKMFKIVEINSWFLIYQSKTIAHLVPKNDMSAAETDQLRTIFRSTNNPNVKLKA